MEEGKNSSRKGLKICCCATWVILVIIVVVAVTLFFTVFKLKQPEVIARPASLENIQFQLIPTFSLNATLGLVITITNRNYGSFKYKNTTSYVSYYGTSVAEIPIDGNKVPARGDLNVTTYANVTGDKLVTNPHFWSDLNAGRFDLASTAALHGKVSVLKIFKLGATVFTECNISVVLQTKAVESVCSSKIKL